MPEQRDLRADLVWARDTKTIMENPESQRFPPFIRSQAVKLAVLAIPALERAIVAEEALTTVVAALHDQDNLCGWCLDHEEGPADPTGHRPLSCKRNRKGRDPEDTEECFAEAMLAEARAKVGL